MACLTSLTWSGLLTNPILVLMATSHAQIALQHQTLIASKMHLMWQMLVLSLICGSPILPTLVPRLAGLTSNQSHSAMVTLYTIPRVQISFHWSLPDSITLIAYPQTIHRLTNSQHSILQKSKMCHNAQIRSTIKTLLWIADLKKWASRPPMNLLFNNRMVLMIS